MNIALIGASGNVGSRILKELTDRRHTVTAIARHPEKIAPGPGVAAKKGDLYDTKGLADLLRGHDAVVSSVFFTASDPKLLVEAVRASGVKRYLVVGGAGSLEVAPGRRLLDTPDFPPEYKPEATKGAEFLAFLKTVKDLDWAFISPSALFVPGRRTGKFRLGGDQLLVAGKDSSISFEDFAVAMADELEKPTHSRTRFTVGY